MRPELTVQENQLAILKTSPQTYFSNLNPRCIEDVFASDVPAIGRIVKLEGQIMARAALAYLIADMLEFFTVKDSMNDKQVAVTIDLIIEEYPYMKLDDFKLCFRNAMKMKYGELYNRIDGQLILLWLKKYNNERCMTAERESYNNHKALNSNDNHSDGYFYGEHREKLLEASKNGDENAINALQFQENIRKELDKRKFERQRKENEEFYKQREIEKQK